MRASRFLLAAGAALLGLLALAATAEAGLSGFAVSPAELAYDDPPALRGSASAGTLLVRNTLPVDLEVTFTPEGRAAGWITLPEGAGPVLLRSGGAHRVPVVVEVPVDAPNGLYETYLRIRGVPVVPLTVQGTGVALELELAPRLRIHVGGEEVRRLSLEGARVRSAVPGHPLDLSVSLVNAGNVRADPVVHLEVRDVDGLEVLSETLVAAALPPRGGATIAFATQGILPGPGSYTLHVTLKRDGVAVASRTVPFQALPSDIALPDEHGVLAGHFVTLDMSAAPMPGTPTRVTATFRNPGDVPILAAKLVGEVFLGERRVAVLASEPLPVDPGEEVLLEATFTPDETGAYRIVTHVVFDGIRTPTRTDHLTVIAPVEPPSYLGSPETPATVESHPQRFRFGMEILLGVLLGILLLAYLRHRKAL